MKDARWLTAELLCKTFKNNSYSNIQLNYGLEDSNLSDRDKRLCSALYYGVIERRITLDYIISGLSKRPVSKLDDTVLNIIRCGLYQLLYMESIPDNAAVNESVALTKKMKKTSASGFVNAVLRGFIRNDKKYAIPKDIEKSSSVLYSAPEWLISQLSSEYGIDKMTSFLENSLENPPLTIKLNTVKGTETEIISQLSDFNLLKCDIAECCYDVIGGGDVTASAAFKNGLFHVQDKASQLCCKALNPKPNDRVLDMCAAPGGKTFTLAELMDGNGEVYAFDLHEKRVKLIADGTKRLGLGNVKAMCGDATVFNEILPKFSKILCDVPCSGLGVIRRKPEIKYKNADDFNGLPDIQYKIVENAINYLEVDGELVYSTCTLSKSENDMVICRLLENHPELEGVTFLEELGEPFGDFKATIFPSSFGSDGFFISKIRKVR